jgi:hypothetical protein
MQGASFCFVKLIILFEDGLAQGLTYSLQQLKLQFATRE